MAPNLFFLTKFLFSRLELTTEKMNMLKEKLDYLTSEKENDIKTFHEIISNSKNVVVEMILTHHLTNTGEDLQKI